ncbi:MAG TPA: O-succinylhomoserine sulfhydrylase [Gammaproteobacteria bacterium]|nr:O-succinylhomoserine sulfhydrylase [Gammaproteobacteria bacterium]
MNHDFDPGLALATLACCAGGARGAEYENSPPIYATSSFCFDSAAQAAARFAGEEPGNIYSRFTNPTVRAFEERLAVLEGGEACIGTASGMSAILTTVLALLASGDHLVCSRSVFGTTVSLLTLIAKFGIETTYVDAVDVAAWAAAIRPNTKMLFLETPSNPLTEISDIAALAVLAREAGAWFVVDNCFCTPALQRPLELGAQIVIHSATKFLDGQGRCVGGAIVAPAELVQQKLFPFLRTAGPSMSPFNAWVFLKGLETLPLRMLAHSATALAIARFLAAHPAVTRVHYPGLETHPQHALAARQQRAFGGIVSFEVKGGQAAAWRVVDALELFSITANLGDTRSIVTHPATTTHGRLSAAQRAEMSIRDELIRLSVGLEDANDLIADLGRALDG